MAKKIHKAAAMDFDPEWIEACKACIREADAAEDEIVDLLVEFLADLEEDEGYDEKNP
jgi:hypothetical protein